MCGVPSGNPPRPPVKPPLCPDCGVFMRLENAIPDEHYKLRHMIFVCDCGRKSDQLVAET
jgi:hypothetical protein